MLKKKKKKPARRRKLASLAKKFVPVLTPRSIIVGVAGESVQAGDAVTIGIGGQIFRASGGSGDASTTDSVNHPSHYNQGKIEVIEYIEDQKLDYHLGNAVKYISRAGKKNPEKLVEDLEKAVWYVRRRIALASGNAPRPNEMPNERKS